MKNYEKAYNALRVTVFGDLEPVFIEDFSASEGLGAAIGFGCRRVDAVSTREMQRLSRRVGFSVVGFVDAHGYEKNHIPNRCLQAISGYDLLMGPGVLCLWEKNDYAPLETEQVERLTRVLCDALQLDDRKKKAAMACFRLVGQTEYEQGLALSREGKFEEAHALFVRAAEQNHPNGINAVAFDYLQGEGAGQDVEKGRALMLRAVELGSPIGNRNLGLSYLDGSDGFPQDHDQAHRHLLFAAMEGDGKAMAWLGYLHIDGEFEGKNMMKAAYWLQQATQENEPMGWYFLAYLIAQDDYYFIQPRYIRYCVDKYLELSPGETLEETVAGLAEEHLEEICDAQPMEPCYPHITGEMASRDLPDPDDQYGQALLLMESPDTARQGMEMLLSAADQGHGWACLSAGSYLADWGQGDAFRFDESGNVTAFPVDDEKCWQYWTQAAWRGEATLLRYVGFACERVEDARAFLTLYAELTGDKAFGKYVLPYLEKALELGEECPWENDEELEALEKRLSYLLWGEPDLQKRIKRLEDALWEATHMQYGDSMAWRLATDPHDSQALSWQQSCKDAEEIRQLLTIYQYIAKLQDTD